MLTLPKEKIKTAKWLYTFWSDTTAPIVAVIEDIEDGKVENAEIVKVLQIALLVLGNASCSAMLPCSS